FARVVVLDLDPGAHAGTDHEQLRLRPALGDVLVLRHKPGNRRGEADPVDRSEVEEVREQGAELVAGPVRLGGDPPAFAELRPLVETEDGLRVAYVDREQHRGREVTRPRGGTARRCAPRAPRPSTAPRPPRRAAPRP